VHGCTTSGGRPPAREPKKRLELRHLEDDVERPLAVGRAMTAAGEALLLAQGGRRCP